MKKKEVGGLPGNVLGMLGDLMVKLQNGGITPRQLAKFLKKENPFITGDYSELIAEWEAFYKKFFGKDCDFSNVVIPEKPRVGRWRLLIIYFVTLELLYAKCKKLFKCWRWTDDDLDEKVVWNERDAKNGAYAIWVRDEAEADEELKNLSANDVKGKGITTETFAERLIHELKFFDETGKYLDIKNVTLCAGSRCDDGGALDVGWGCGGGGLVVHWCPPGYAAGNLRSRQTVS